MVAPVWAAHRHAANATMIDWTTCTCFARPGPTGLPPRMAAARHLWQPPFNLSRSPRSCREQRHAPVIDFAATAWHPIQRCAAARRQRRPVCTEHSPNTFACLPVHEGEPGWWPGPVWRRGWCCSRLPTAGPAADVAWSCAPGWLAL